MTLLETRKLQGARDEWAAYERKRRQHVEMKALKDKQLAAWVSHTQGPKE